MRPHRQTRIGSMNRLILTLGVAALAFLATHPASAQTGSEATTPAAETPAIVTLTPQDVERFIAAVTELGELGLRLTGSSAADVAQMTEEMSTQDEAAAILAKYDFDLPEFRDVGYSVMMAYAAGELEDAQIDVTAARDQFAALQGLIPEDQYRMLEQQIAEAQRTIAAQPQSNVELVRTYKALINAATL